MLRYKIISKRNPSLILMEVSVATGTFEESKKRHLFLLSHSMHPNPDMQNHLIKFGIMDFDFVPVNFTEQSIIIPEKEIRNGKKGRKKGQQVG